MFEQPSEQQNKSSQIRKELIDKFTETGQIKKWSDLFHNIDNLRLTYNGYDLLQNHRKFYTVEIKTDTFKVQDIIKISRLNSDLYFIESKKPIIHSCDELFINWCHINECNIDAIRNSADF